MLLCWGTANNGKGGRVRSENGWATKGGGMPCKQGHRGARGERMGMLGGLNESVAEGVWRGG